MTLIATSALDLSHGVANDLVGLKIPDLTLIERADVGGILVLVSDDGDKLTDQLETLLGVQLPRCHGATGGSQGHPTIWMTPRSWLVTCTHVDEAALCVKTAAAFPDRSVHATRFGDYLCWLELSGEGAENALEQGSFVSFNTAGLEPQHAKRTPVAGIPAVLFRQSYQTWWIGIERSRAAYFLNWLQSLQA